MLPDSSTRVLVAAGYSVDIISVLCSFFFFFSSRRRHTRCSRDWSSDVCSSDLVAVDPDVAAFGGCTGSPMVDAPVKNNPRAYAGSNARTKNISIPAPGAPFCFCQSCCVGVIVDFHVHVVETAHFPSQRIVMPDYAR